MQLELLPFFFSLYGSITLSSAWTIRNTSLKWELVSRIYSSVHACTSSCLSLYYLYSNNYLIYLLLLTNSYTYVIFDMIIVSWKYRHIHNDRLFWFHHIMFLLGLRLFGNTPALHHKVARMLLLEISTICLNHGWFVYKHHIHDIESTVAKILTATTYFVFRILNLTLMVYQETLFSPTGIYILSLTCLNYYWFYKIVSKFFY